MSGQYAPPRGGSAPPTAHPLPPPAAAAPGSATAPPEITGTPVGAHGRTGPESPWCLCGNPREACVSATSRAVWSGRTRIPDLSDR